MRIFNILKFGIINYTFMNSFFSGRKLIIATKHKKESVIAPIFETYIGVSVEVADVDTDTL